jgi:hypothetical protein
MTKNEKLKNVLAFCSILFGESDIWWDHIMEFNPDYLIEKFERYIEHNNPSSPWGLHPSLRRKVFNKYLDKYGIEYDDT